MRVAGKCEAIIRSLLRSCKLRLDTPGEQIRLVIIGSTDLKIVIEVRGVYLLALTHWSSGSHQRGWSGGKAVNFVSKVTIGYAGRGDGCDSRHAMRILHIGHRCRK